MNIAFFLIPKSQIAYLYDDFTLRQGLEKMRYHGYAAIPVIDRDGKYVGSISEGDFLWHLIDDSTDDLHKIDITEIKKTKIRDLLRPDRILPVRITETAETLLDRATKQNYIPVIDDTGSFIGIITRKGIINYFCQNIKPEDLDR